MLILVETVSVGGSMASEGDAHEVVHVEVLAKVPKSSSSPRSRPTTIKEGHKTNNDKYKATQSVRESPRKH